MTVALTRMPRSFKPERGWCTIMVATQTDTNWPQLAIGVVRGVHNGCYRVPEPHPYQ
jgi:hypothetical protein